MTESAYYEQFAGDKTEPDKLRIGEVVKQYGPEPKHVFYAGRRVVSILTFPHTAVIRFRVFHAGRGATEQEAHLWIFNRLDVYE